MHADREMYHRAHGVVVSHALRMRKAQGSDPSVSIVLFCKASSSESSSMMVIEPTAHEYHDYLQDNRNFERILRFFQKMSSYSSMPPKYPLWGL